MNPFALLYDPRQLPFVFVLGISHALVKPCQRKIWTPHFTSSHLHIVPQLRRCCVRFAFCSLHVQPGRLRRGCHCTCPPRAEILQVPK